ncbi:hypothetical protein CB1_000057013 [Camelus ferus]|nr:hypothetical protein CB1_000057013 [Camelus ferus]
MLSPQRALLCNLNHIHLQHVSLGLHLSRRPELREGPLSTSPPPGDTGGKESRGPCSGTLVDANSNSPAVPCRCCQEHGPGLENRQDPAQEEEGAASPSDPGCSSSLSSCSDLSPDESPISVYSRELPGNEDIHPQPSIVPLEQGSPLASAGPGACSPDSFCCSPDSCSEASSPPGPGLDSNCNALTTCQDLPSPGLEEEDEGGEQDLPTSDLPEADDEKIDTGKTEPSWKINPIWKIDTEKTEAGWKIPENNNSVRSSWSFAGVSGAQRLWMAEAQGGTGQLQEQKKGLLIAVSASVDKIISHFGAARNLVQKAQLGDSRLSPDVGHLVLTTLCPALHALVADGLKPFRKDLITGQRRSSPWSVVEASVKPGSSTRSLGTLYSQVSHLAPLRSSRSRFHAFILGLLNTKQLELWFSSLQEDAGLLSLLYLPTGFFSLARGGCPSLSTELLLLLQPLSVLTFHLDLLFEHHHHLPLGPPQARSRRHGSGTAAEVVQERSPPAEEAAPGRGVWLGRLFGVPGGLTETEGGAPKSRRPSSWLPPTVSVLTLVRRGAPPETPSSPEDLEASASSMAQTHRAVRALCDHTAAGPDQLSFRRGEVLRVVATVDEDWLRCGRDGVEGLVPVGYTSLVL